MRAVVLERNRLVGRRVARHVAAIGGTAAVIEDPAQLPALAADATLICADVFDGDAVVAATLARPGLRAVLWTAEPLKRALRHLGECPAIGHVLGRRDFDSPPRPWELGLVLRRLLAPVAAPLPLAAYLDWGHAGFELAIATSADRDAAVARIQTVVGELQVPRRLAEIAGELTHELLMNALYDAPTDGDGRPRHAHDRKAAVALPPGDAAVLRLGSDGSRLVLQVRDRFGGLRRAQVVDGLTRGLASGELDRSGGGAGLGLTVCHQSSLALFFELGAGRHTQVTATLDLDLNLRELKTHARSLHLWES